MVSDVILPDSLLDNASFPTGPNGENIMELDVNIANGEGKDGLKKWNFKKITKQINRDWNTGNVTIGNTTYEIRVNLTVTDVSSADVTVLDAQRFGYSNHRVDRIGGTKIYVRQGSIGKYTGSHEFGHLLGLQHQNNATGRLMSYAYDRNMSPYRVQDLYRAYSQGSSYYDNSYGAP